MKEFKAHSQKVLELMINSVYTNKEIFLRELVSNASDAVDKAKYLSLTDSLIGGEFFIEIEVDKERRVLTVSDTGIGMDENELEENLSTIAESGTLKFKRENKTGEQLIGQFGVGFYSGFMVADKIEVLTKKQGGQGYKWVSDGKRYFIEAAEKAERGTSVALYLKQPDEDCDYERFLDTNYLAGLIKKYSDYIRWPIYMETEKSVPKEGDKEWEVVKERKVINSMVPIWKRAKEADKEELDNFFKAQYYIFEPPLETLSFNIEGAVNYRALLFLPEKAPFDYYSAEYVRGLSLYSSGVMIMENCKELLPDYLGFVKGVVETDDVSLNISREMLQKDRALTAIAKSIEKKVLSALEKMLKNEREKYERLFNAFGSGIKFGIYNSFGAKKTELQDLLLYYSSSQKTFVTLKEYVSRMGENKNILYAARADIEAIERLPVLDYIKEKGFEVLYLTDRIDEFVIKILNTYEDKPIKSVLDKDLDLDLAGGKKEEGTEDKKLIDDIKECLKDKVSAVKVSGLLKKHPVLLSSANEISLEMEKVLNSVNKDNKAKAQRVLELNPAHPVFDSLKNAAGDKERLMDLSLVLYYQAVILSGLEAEEPIEFCDAVNRLITV